MQCVASGLERALGRPSEVGLQGGHLLFLLMGAFLQINAVRPLPLSLSLSLSLSISLYIALCSSLSFLTGARDNRAKYDV